MKSDKFNKICDFLRDKMADEDYAKVEQMLRDGVDDPAAAGMDMALDAYRSPAVKSVARYNAAVRKVAHVMPTVPMACDSAEAVFSAALERLGVDLAGVEPSAYEFVFDSAGRFGARRDPGDNVSSTTRKAIEAQSPGLSRFLGAA